MVDKNEQPDNGKNGLDDAKDASREKASICSSQPEAAENRRAVVIDCIDTRAL